MAASWYTLQNQGLNTSRSDATAFVIAGKMYLCGGYAEDYTVLSSCVVMNILGGSYIFLPGIVANKPTASGDLENSVFNNKVI